MDMVLSRKRTGKHKHTYGHDSKSPFEVNYVEIIQLGIVRYALPTVGPTRTENVAFTRFSRLVQSGQLFDSGDTRLNAEAHRRLFSYPTQFCDFLRPN
jgi:hypothetical protein